MTTSSVSSLDCKALPPTLPPRPIQFKLTSQIPNQMEQSSVQDHSINPGEDSDKMRETEDLNQASGSHHEHDRSQRSSFSNHLPPSLPPRPRNKSIVEENPTNPEVETHNSPFASQDTAADGTDSIQNNATPRPLNRPTIMSLSDNSSNHINPDQAFSAALSNHSVEEASSDEFDIDDQCQKYDIIKDDHDSQSLEELEDLEIEEYLKQASKELKEVTIQTISQDQSNPKPKLSDFISKSSTNEIDWLRYGESYLIYQLESVCPTSLLSPEVIPNASVSQLRLHLQRCYVLAPPEFWNSLLEGKLGDLYRWTHPTRSAKYCLLYILLWIFDLIPSFMIGYFLYLIIKRQFNPPSISQLKRESNQRRLLNQEAEQLGTGLLSLKNNDGHRLSMLTKGIGGSTSVFAAPVIPELSSKRSKDLPKNLESPNKVKGHIGIYRLGKCLYSHYGIHVQLILSDFAEIGEKVKNLYLWRHPKSCKSTSIKLFLILIYTTSISPKWLMKNFLAWLGFEFFLIFKLIETYPKFRKLFNPIYLIFYEIPNDSEYILHVLKQRSLKNSNHQDEISQLKNHQFEDQSLDRQSFMDDNRSVSSGSDRSKRWRKKAVESGVETYRKLRKTYHEYSDKPDGLDRNLDLDKANPNYRTFAVLNGKAPGTLVIKQDEIWFEPLKGFRTKGKSSIKSNEESLINSNDQGHKTDQDSKSNGLNVLVFESQKIIRLKKIRSFGFGMIGGDGIEIELENQIVRFGNVSHRDQTFHQLLFMTSLSEKLSSS